MARQPESRLVKKIQDRIKLLGGFPVKLHGGDNPFQQAGISDLLICYHGMFVAIEAKMPGQKPSALQRTFLRQVKEAGGVAGVAYSVEEAEELLLSAVNWPWIAGFFEGEGHAGIRSDKGMRPLLNISQSNIEVLEEIQRQLGFGRIYAISNKLGHGRLQNYRLIIGRVPDQRRFIDGIMPHCYHPAKIAQLELLQELLNLCPGTGNRLTTAQQAEKELIFRKFKQLSRELQGLE
jgi:hypothetical protein